MKEYEVTSTRRFYLGKDQAVNSWYVITVEYSDLASGWHWRLRVNDQVTDWGGGKMDILYLNGIAVVSEYFGSGIKPWVPFYITYATEDKS